MLPLGGNKISQFLILFSLWVFYVQERWTHHHCKKTGWRTCLHLQAWNFPLFLSLTLGCSLLRGVNSTATSPWYFILFSASYRVLSCCQADVYSYILFNLQLILRKKQVYCNMAKHRHNTDGRVGLSVIHECLTPLKIRQGSLWDQVGLIKASTYYSP